VDNLTYLFFHTYFCILLPQNFDIIPSSSPRLCWRESNLSLNKSAVYFFLTKSGLGHILGDFLASSSGHPDRKPPLLTPNGLHRCNPLFARCRKVSIVIRNFFFPQKNEKRKETTRVTRLCKFSPLCYCFLWAVFQKCRSSPNVWPTYCVQR
jgi:hypothetical protein